MILDNAKPRLEEAFKNANESKEPKEVKFIYNELDNHDTIIAVFEWLYRNSISFQTKYEEYRFVVVIYPKHNYGN